MFFNIQDFPRLLLLKCNFMNLKYIFKNNIKYIKNIYLYDYKNIKTKYG